VTFDLVIFDCDGVLVDSERITNTVFAAMLNELGLAVTLQDMFRDFVGRSMAQCVEMIEARLGRPVPDAWLDEYRTRTVAALARDLKPVSGIEAALDAIDIPCCVASSGDHDKMRATLGLIGLLPRFDGRLYSVTQVERGKPHPDVFLFAASRMGAAPDRCAVVEDTFIGARAGVAAGMTVFGYAALSDPEALSAEGAIVFDDMAGLPALLGAAAPRRDRVKP
jgi:HAD superfamily hydrolase (TIGR01509 family)